MKETEKSDTIRLTRKEFVFLCSIIGGNTILGIDDPFIIHTEEDIKNEWPLLAKALEDKNYIMSGDEGEIIIDNDIASVLRTCCEPQSYIIIENESEQDNFKKIYYVTLSMAVELYTGPETNSDILIKTVPTVQDINTAVIESVLSPHEYLELNPSDVKISISEDNLTRIVSEESGMELEEACLLIREAGFEESNTLSLAGTLLNPLSKTTFLSLGNNEFNKLEGTGFAVFKGSDSMWIVTPDAKEGSFLVTAYNKENITASVQNLLDRINNTYLFGDEHMIKFFNELISLNES